MSTSLEHLPTDKTAELLGVKDIILKHLQPEMIILFGSYATKDQWVDSDIYQDDSGTTYEYRSDYDILVVTKHVPSSVNWHTYDIDKELDRNPFRTDVSIIFHSIGFLNEKIRTQYYFFMDIFNKGICLYDTGNYILDRPQKLSPTKRVKKATDYFEQWIGNAEISFKGYIFFFKQKDYNKAAFELHQATESYYAAVLLIFTDYRPKLHDIKKLGKNVIQIHAEFYKVFPCDTEEKKIRFELLRKAYVDARYKKDYTITPDELTYLAERVKILKAMVVEVCQKEIERFAAIAKATQEDKNKPGK